MATYGQKVKIYEGVLLQHRKEGKSIDILLTHGHQGDGQSDGNKFSAWFVAKVWAPLQSYLELNINTPAFNDILKTEHNQFMYEWSSQQENLLLVTGHTHQPVFESMTHLERLYKLLLIARQQNDTQAIAKLQEEIAFRRQEYDHVSEDYLHLKPTYFNTGCCCFSDGDITGIEIDNGAIRLIKWKKEDSGSKRSVLEKTSIATLLWVWAAVRNQLWGIVHWNTPIMLTNRDSFRVYPAISVFHSLLRIWFHTKTGISFRIS